MNKITSKSWYSIFSIILILSNSSPLIGQDGLHGYIASYPAQPPASYSEGYGFYSGIWPLVRTPVANFQIGLPSSWIIPDNSDNSTIPLCPVGTVARDNWPERGPTYSDVFQTVEGGPGYWAGNKFHYGPPKFKMNSTPNCYSQEISTPGWQFFWSDTPLPDSVLGIAQISNCILMPPDGMTFQGNPNGDLLGISYLSLPLTPAYTDKYPVGEKCWTLFLNALNFKGPLAYYLPETWAKISKNYPFDYGRGLDARPTTRNLAGGTMEFNTVPIMSANDANENLSAQVRPYHIFDNNMVLQREKPVKVWGLADPQEKVKVEFGGQAKSTVANKQGEWSLFLDPMSANAKPGDMKVSGKRSSVLFTNVLVGDVWILGGQSNMEFDLARIFHGDVEILSAHFPDIRLMTIPCSANLKPQKDFERINEYDGWYERYDKKGYWFICSPETVPTFSGLGYIFGKRLYMASKVPIGLIDISMGGTTVEAWLKPETLAATPENSALLKQWNDKVAGYDPVENLKTQIRNWEKDSAARIKEGQKPEPKPVEPSPGPSLDRNFPGSSYTGMVAVIAGLSVKGIVFHQGYNNALEDSRPKLYASNFKALINDWRTTFNDKDLPFGIVETSAGGEPQTPDNFELRMIDPTPSVREGQFKAYQDMPNTGYICSYDQQVNWYHPQKKAEVAERMARWALSTQYGFDLGWEPAICTGIERQKDRIIITFNKEVKTSDDRPIEGFCIAGSDRHFYPAKAVYSKTKDENGKPVDDKKRIEVSNNLTVDPVEVRYAWARNPLGNLVNLECPIIPVPLFRTDTWDYPEAPYLPDEYAAHRANLKNLRKQATEMARLRIISEAESIRQGQK